MEQRSSRRWDYDPFLVTTANVAQHKILHWTGLVRRDVHHDDEPRVGGVKRAANPIKLRCLFAFGCVLATVVPVIIMVLKRGDVVVFATTGGFLLTFACLIVLFPDLSPRDVLTITAAYAGILVVFVGNIVSPRNTETTTS